MARNAVSQYRRALTGALALTRKHARLRELTDAAETISEASSAHLAKHSAMLARVALTYHCITLADHRADMEAEPMRAAVSFMRKIARHSVAMYFDTIAASGAPGVVIARDVARMLIAHTPSQIRRRDLARKVRAFRCAAHYTQDSAMQYLTDCNWIEPMPSAYDILHRADAVHAGRVEKHRGDIRVRYGRGADRNVAVHWPLVRESGETICPGP
jgi:hypothetical protein